MAPISIDFLANVGPFLRGTKDVEGALDDVSSALDDVARDGEGIGDGIGDSLRDAARDGERAGDDIGRSMEDAARYGERAGDKIGHSLQDAARDGERAGDEIGDSMKDAAREGERAGESIGDSMKDGARESERSVDKIEDSFRDMARKVKADTKAAGDGLGDSMQDGASRASDGVREIGDEAASTAKEAAASFDGSAESIGDAFQEVAANAFAGFGPAGLIAGVAAAAGIGVVLTKLQEGGEESEAMKQKVADLTAELVEVGSESGPSLDYLVGRLKEMASSAEDGEQSLTDLYKLSEGAAASSFEKIAQAYAGNVDGLDALIEKERRHQKSLEDEAASIDTTKETSYGAALSRAEDSRKIVEGLERARDIASEAQLAEEAYAASGAAELEAKAERTAAYADSIAENLTEAGADWEQFADRESGALNLEKYNEYLEQRQTAMANYRTNMQGLQGNINQDALNYLQSLGADAAPLLQAYVDAPNDQKERTAANWATLGRTASSSYTADLKAGIPSSVAGPNVVIPRPDMSPVERAIQDFGTRRIVVNVTGNITKIGQQVYD